MKKAVAVRMPPWVKSLWPTGEQMELRLKDERLSSPAACNHAQ
jgi:hypothetical protein